MGSPASCLPIHPVAHAAPLPSSYCLPKGTGGFTEPTGAAFNTHVHLGENSLNMQGCVCALCWKQQPCASLLEFTCPDKSKTKA